MPERRSSALGRYVLGFIIATALWGVVWLLLLVHRGVPAEVAPTHRVTVTHYHALAPTQALSLEVSQRFAQLHVRPKTVTLSAGRALAAQMAIKHGEYAQATHIVAAVLAHSRLESWRFYPFDQFMDRIIGAGNDPALLAHLNAWVHRDPRSALAYLIRAQYYHATGWAARGTSFIKEVPARDQRLFSTDMALADADVRKSLSLDAHDPWSYLLLLRVVSDDANSGRMAGAFEQAIRAYPRYYPLYRLRLYTLTPKWGGSVRAMYEFVNRYAGAAPRGSPLKLLYLQLYANLVNAAAIDCESLRGSARQRCLTWEMNHIVSAKMAAHMLRALRLYKASDPIQFDEALWPVLREMAATRGSNDWAGLGALLQMAGRIMGSDSELSEHSVHNNFVLDDVTARIWQQLGNSHNVIAMYRDALRDIAHTKFPDQAQRDEAEAKVYEHMVKFANDRRDHVDIIVYQRAAETVGGHNLTDDPYVCYAYELLGHFERAAQQCTHMIRGHANTVYAHFWRARAYQHMHRWRKALADFGIVADSSNNYFRVEAAIDMSVIYGGQHQFAAELTSLDAHPYLFDPTLETPDDLAVSYNNRCYAYMKLDRLHKALADCTTSLKYGRLPDAMHKQLVLMKKLGIATSD